MRPTRLAALLDMHAQNREPCGLIAAPGVGKTSLITQAALRNGFEASQVLVMNLVNRDPTDMSGLPFVLQLPDGTKCVEWVKQKQFLTQGPICLFMDELFQAPTATQNVAAPIILEKRIDDIFLNKDSWVVFASNRMEDKAGTNRVPSHIPNRCSIYFGPEVNIDDWSSWALDSGLDFRVVQYLRSKPNALSDFDPGRMVNPTPRQWEWVARRLANIPDDLMFDAIAGRVGEGLATEVRAFIKLSDQLPSREQILIEPKKAPVPKEPSALYMVTGMLANAATKNNFDQIAIYMQRVPEEFQAMLVKDTMRLTPGIISTKAFTSWAVKFAEVLR